ncbi:conserved hypothetical protein [Leishmania infantum JPCM5]|uniref:Uncharacterized protein n=2 Tax=Leishmania infantum TaxID=5671 RepID=A4IAI2_LEIIN|nr:conserved hypothetical protein [Leishmania infantum JPCM5]CAC9541590.1 hypothetical_protein_-_conserved [Leishmania infantum]CAM71839.1 conserved hypothetical protein [Leishmania infantum JPCM5]SUZ45794.1 hypothetical_protein_-_conserved [Leishmania infantum]|eukprot:XP_001468751.1 conserved hypothetical protein [Leishmania infantum JPCM5]
MAGNTSHVKQLLSTARMYRRSDMLHDIVCEVRDAEMTTSRFSAELRVLCAEVAVELKQWSAAAELLKGLGAAQETRLLAVRRAFCEVLVSLHHVDENTSLTEDEKVQEYVAGAASALQALAEAVEVWPDSLDAVLTGIRTLWLIASPLLSAGHEADVCDAVAFLATLHQQLHIGGGYTLVQWLVRAALCLRAAERPNDALTRFSAALEAAALMGNQRLFVQVLRLAAGVILVKEKANVSSKTRSDLLPSYRNRPVHFAVLLTHLVLGGCLEMEACKEDLQSAYHTLSDVADVAQQPPETGASAPRGRKKQAAVKLPPAIRLVDTFAVTESDVIDEVKSDLLLCISLHGTLSPEQVEELEQKRSSSNHRVRSFAAFALVVRESHRHGLRGLGKCADASSISAAHRAELRTLAGELVDVLKNTNTIHDESERQHTLRTGASLLWNLVLPFLQTSTMGDAQAALAAVADVSQAFMPALRKLFLQVTTQQCHTAFEEDNRSLLHQLLPMLQRECQRGEVDGAAPACLFRLQWLQHQMAIREEPESSLTSQEDRCLFAIEQCRGIANPLKRVSVIKTAFRHLPSIVEENDAHTTVAEASELQMAAPAGGALCTRRSTVQLYRELLELCMQDLSASLYAVAMAVAEALRGLPCPLPGAGAADIEEVRAAASLHAATILARQLEEAEPHGAQKDVRSASVVDHRTAAIEESENRLAALLIEAAQRGAEVESRRSGSGGWIAANACVAFLKWKKLSYERGEYRAHLAELLDLQKLYTALYEHDQVQDVELLSDLTTSSVLGLVAEYLETSNPPAGAGTSPLATQMGRDGFAAHVRRLRMCANCEPSNVQLRRAHAMCLEALQIIPGVKQKWFLAMLSPALARLVGDKPRFSPHPQEQLFILLGILAGPSAVSEKVALLINDARPLLRKDPCVRLCAWVAAVATQLGQEEVALECCEVADRLYASNRLGWGSLLEMPSPFSPGGGALAAPGKTTDSGSHKKASMEPALAQLDGQTTFSKPDAEDWEAYAELLYIKAQVGVQHLHGLVSVARNRAVQLLLTNCVNAAIAAVQGPAASKVEHITNAYTLYYTFLRTTRISLETATFVLPSLRMLLSKALLAQLPKRSWSDSFTEVVYQLSCVLVHVSLSSEQDDDARQLVAVLRHLRELLPPRYQKSLKDRELTEVCYRNPSIDDFLQRSKNMEAELQARGWMIVALASKDITGEAEAFALALAASQGGSLATAQCLFENAYAATLRRGDSTPLAQVTRHLQEALRTLEGLPAAAPLLQSLEETDRWHATLADASLTATFLRSQPQRHCPHNGDVAGEVAEAARGERQAAPLKASVKAHSTKITGVTFHHAFLGLRIVSLLFRTTPSHDVVDVGAASVKAAKYAPAPASRRDCAKVMLDYVSCLWHLSAKWLCEGAADEETVALKLPIDTSLYYNYAEPSAAAQRLRRCVPDEEFKLNTEGLWQCLLDLGDYLARTGDEPHSFMVYSWVRFSVALAFGGARGDSRCGLVQRLCNWKMCAAAASSGLSDDPYVAALNQLADTRSLVEEAVKRDVEGKCVSPSSEAAMVVSECEVRIHLGQTEQAATLAEDVLCRGLECASWNTAATRARALRVRARHEAICLRYGDALRTLQQAFQLIGAATPSSAPTVISVPLWTELCSDRLAVLMDSQATAEAVQWAGTVRQQLHQWRAAASPSAMQVDTTHTACLRADVEDALELWISRLVTTLTPQVPVGDALSHPTACSPPEHRRADTEELLRELLLVAEGPTTLHSCLYTTHAKWHVRDRVTPQWLAQHSAKVDDVRTRLLVLLAEMRVLDELSLRLQTARASCKVGVGSPGQGEVDAATATSMSFWQGALVYWTAIDRLEASELASYLLVAFRHLSMEDLQLPTSSAPAHCEREVLRLIRGAASSSCAATVERAPHAEEQAVMVGARWQRDGARETDELRQALQHYSVTDARAQYIMDVSAVPALLEKAAAHCRQWPHTRLAAAIVVAVAQVEVLQRVENQLEQCDDLVGEELQAQTHALLTAAWSRARLIPARIEKPGSRMRKGVPVGKQRKLSEPTSSAPVRPLTEEEAALLQRISRGIQVAVHHGHLDAAADLSDALSHLAVLLERPHIAAAAAERTQANQLVGLLWRSCVHEMADGAEGRLWRQMLAVQPLFTNCTSYMQLADQIVTATPMRRGLRSCSLLCVQAEEEVAAVASTAPGKGGHATEVSPYAVDSAVLSVAMGNYRTGFCIVTLRHPDGAVEGRRRHVPQQTWATLAATLQRIETQKQEQLGSADDVGIDAAEERVTAEDLSSMLEELNTVALGLFGEFQASLQQYCEKTPLYLCLAPELQPFPWEQTCVLSCCSVVLRELGAAAVVSRTGELQRSGKRSLQHPTKPAGPSSTKGSSAGPLVCLVDLFGDHRESVPAICGTDQSKSKVPPQCLLTCSSAGVPPDATYLTWMLRNTAPGALIVNMCGSLTDALPWSYLASLTFTQLHSVVLADGAFNTSSQWREEQFRLLASATRIGKAGSPPSHPRWMTQTLFLLRGAKFVAANALPCSPCVTDALARRCLSSASSGKALVEQLRGKSRDTKMPFVTLYGVLLGSGPSKAKA